MVIMVQYKVEDILKLEDIIANIGSTLKTLLNKQQTALSNIPAKFKVNDRVKLSGGNTGIVRYIGVTHFSHNEEMIGIELDSWIHNGHDGNVKGKRYFMAAPGRGVFVHRNNVAHVVLPDQINNKHLDILPDVSDRVRLINDDIALVQWIENSNKIDSEKSIQVKLIHGNNYDLNDEQETLKNVTLKDLVENLGRDYSKEEANSMEAIEFKVGDHVRLARGKTGIIKYIGQVGVMDELIGLELDSWTSNGHDGKGYFKCQRGRGYFTTRSTIKAVIPPPDKSEQERLQIKRLRNLKKKKCSLPLIFYFAGRLC